MDVEKGGGHQDQEEAARGRISPRPASPCSAAAETESV